MTRPGSRHRAWIEIDHAALRTNLGIVRGLAGGAQVIAVVKANAYGHGAVAVARTLVAAGAERLAVATVEEGIELRDAGVESPILLLWGIGPDEAAEVVAHDLEPIVTDEATVALLERETSRAGRRLSVHLKVDTGLGRQGAGTDEALTIASRVARSAELVIAGTMSHLAVPGEDDAYTEVQQLRLARVVDAMRSSGIDPGCVHVSASGGILAGGTVVQADAVRPGLALYGLVPAWAADRDPGLRPALSLKARPCASSTCRPARRSATGSAFERRRRPASRRSESGTGTDGPASMPTTGWRSCAASVRRWSAPSAWTGS